MIKSLSMISDDILICVPAGKSNRAAERFPQRRSESTGEGAGPAWGDRLPTPFPRQVHKRVAALCFILSEHTTERAQGSGVIHGKPWHRIWHPHIRPQPPFLISLAPPGPGLSIRVICAEEAFICKDFAETNNMLKIITDFSASVKKVGIKTDR